MRAAGQAWDIYVRLEGLRTFSSRDEGHACTGVVGALRLTKHVNVLEYVGVLPLYRSTTTRILLHTVHKQVDLVMRLFRHVLLYVSLLINYFVMYVLCQFNFIWTAQHMLTCCTVKVPFGFPGY